jgi:hypothetical protein
MAECMYAVTTYSHMYGDMYASNPVCMLADRIYTGLARTVYIHCIFGDFPAKKAVLTPQS